MVSCLGLSQACGRNRLCVSCVMFSLCELLSREKWLSVSEGNASIYRLQFWLSRAICGTVTLLWDCGTTEILYRVSYDWHAAKVFFPLTLLPNCVGVFVCLFFKPRCCHGREWDSKGHHTHLTYPTHPSTSLALLLLSSPGSISLFPCFYLFVFLYSVYSECTIFFFFFSILYIFLIYDFYKMFLSRLKLQFCTIFVWGCIIITQFGIMTFN